MFADWLDEQGEYGLAGVIRLAQELRMAGDDVSRGYAMAALFNRRRAIGVSNEAANAVALAYPAQTIELTADQLTASDFRSVAAGRPEWFGATELRVTGGRITTAEPFDVMFSSAATRRVTKLRLVGIEEWFAEVIDLGVNSPPSQEYKLRPVVTTSGVVALAAHRGAVRLTELDLSNNELDSDAARALARSPYLENLKVLRVMDGYSNRFRGRVWQLLVERFGHDVLGGDAADDEFPE